VAGGGRAICRPEEGGLKGGLDGRRVPKQNQGRLGGFQTANPQTCGVDGMEYQHWTIKEAMNRVGANKLYLPAIQRKFVWGTDQIQSLFDSIMRDYPIGTFLFWKVEEAKQNDYSFYEFIRDYHERDNWKNHLAAKPHLPDELVGVLDGQQRLNSMFVALQGSYAYKRPRVWANNPNAYPRRTFFLNVFRPEVEEEDEDYVYDFRFLTDEEAREVAPDTCWCLVKDLLECKGLPQVNKYWAKRRKGIEEVLQVSEEAEERALNMLGRLWERLTTIPIINYFPVENQNLDEILDIFVRVNSAGTPLAKTDLLFSTIVAHWEDGRQVIEEFLQEINGKGNGFRFDTDFIMRACLVLTECPVRLRVASFKDANVKLIVKDWKAITRAIARTVDLLAEWGFQGETLTSVNAVIPIAYAIKRGCNVKASNRDLRLLLVKSLLNGVYGRSGDQVLSGMRSALSQALKEESTFKLPAFEKKVRLPGGMSLAMSEDGLDDLLLSTKGARTFALLSLLNSHLKFNQVQFHQDHIHPYAGFNTAALRKLMLSDAQIFDWQAMRDSLPNLQLLEGAENQAKRATPFGTWLENELPEEKDRRSYLRSHDIPSAVPLDLKDFGAFFDARKAMLREKLAPLLGVATRKKA
jgi:hypothetical protein